jgi:predicted nucleic acid-binding protein
MMRLFLDSSVLFSAAYSVHGHAHDLIRMALDGEIAVVTSEVVLTETRRNLASSAPEKLSTLERLLAHIPFEFVRPTKRDVETATRHVVLKDAPILAAARKARVDFLVTLDKKHLLGKPELARYARPPIATPQEVMQHLTRKS